MRANKKHSQKVLVQSGLILICFFVLLIASTDARVFDDFSTASNWEVIGEGGADTANSSVEVASLAGKQALKISYRLPERTTGSRYLTIRYKKPNLISAPFSFYVYGNNCGKSLRLRATDQSGEIFQYTWGRIDWEGEWRQVVFNDLAPGESWSGNNNKIIDGGLSFGFFIIDYGTGEEINDTLYIAQMEAPDFSDTASIEFTDSAWSTTTGLYFWNGGDGVADFLPDLGGKTARQTDPIKGRHYLYMNVDDTFMYGQDAKTVLEVEVEYYDDKFSIWGPVLQYCAIGGSTKGTLPSEFMGNNLWRKAKFLIPDFDFTNRLNDTDFRILGDERYGSGKPIAVHRVAVRKLPIASLTGKITFAGNPLEGVTINSYHPDYPFSPISAKTNGQGIFTIEKLPPGQYMLVASKNGLSSLVEQVSIQEGANTLPDKSMSLGYNDGVWIELGQYYINNGLYFSQGAPEGAAFISQFDGQYARCSNRASGNFFLLFNVDDNYIFDQLGPVDLTVTYYDRGTGNWRIDYDARDNNWKVGPEIKKTNTQTWKTETVRLLDARFANRANGVDFRLNAKWDAGEDDDYFAFVKIKKVSTSTVSGTVQDTNPSIPVLLEGAQVTLTDLDFSNVSYSATTDGAGNFSIADVAVGTYRLTVSLAGYETYSTTVEVDESGATILAELVEGFLGFEDSLWPEKSSGATFAIDKTTFHSGAGSVKGVGGLATQQWMCTGRQPVSRNMNYELSVWIKTENISSPTGISINALQVTADNSANGWVSGQERLLSTGGTQSWTKYVIPIEGSKLNTNTETIKIFVRIYENVTGTVWFDDVQFNPILSTATLNGSKDAFSPALGQTISLDYAVPISALVTLDVLNEAGEIIKTIVSQQPLRGSASTSWDGKDEEEVLADGLYAIRLQATKDSHTVTTIWNVTVDGTGPSQPIITYPQWEEGKTLTHNRNYLSIAGSVDEPSVVKVLRRFGEATEEVKSGNTDPRGKFQLTVPLLEGDNHLWIVAYDNLGNPSENSIELLVNYDPNRSVGVINIENGELISPADENGVRDSLEISFHLLEAGVVEFLLTQDEKVVFSQEQIIDQGQDVQISWNGRNQEGLLLADGTYEYSLIITIGEEKLIPVAGQIRLDNTPPLVPVILYPAIGGTITGIPQLKWEQLPDAAYYLVFVGTQKDLSAVSPAIVTDNMFKLTGIESGTYYWQVVAVDEAGNHSESAESSFVLTALGTNTFDLINFNVFPNPFTPNRDGRREKLMITYTLQQAGQVEIYFYNLSGKLVTYFDLGQQEPGDHIIEWDGSDNKGSTVKAGTYVLRLVATNPAYGAPAVTRKPILVIR